MKFTIARETLLKPLQLVIGVVERRQTLPVLSNILVEATSDSLTLTGTDLEVSLAGRAPLEKAVIAGKITVPRKLMDICRTLPEQVDIDFYTEDQKVIIKAGRSRFTLSTLPASDFPNVEDGPGNSEFSIKNKELRYLIDRAHFAMAQQDVRYYLNGLLLEIDGKSIRAVATDGHRLALSQLDAQMAVDPPIQVIVPRKGITELLRLLNDSEDEVAINLGPNHIRVVSPDFTFISKLIDGRFPDYGKVVPAGGDKVIVIDRDILKQTLTRAAILSNEKFRGVRFQLRQGVLHIIANNPEQEEAEEELSIDYQGEDLDIGFNVSYLLDVLGSVPAGPVRLTFIDANSSLRIEEVESNKCIYVVMPMRL